LMANDSRKENNRRIKNDYKTVLNKWFSFRLIK